MIKIGSKEVPNETTELTVEQFEEISELFTNQELPPIDKWMQVFARLGANQEDLDEADHDTFIGYVRDFVSAKPPSAELVKSVEIDGYTYQSFDEEFKLNIKDLRFVEKYIHEHKKNFMGKVLAILFKRTDLTKTEHYDESHITFKSKLFKSQPAELAIPFIVYIGEKLGSSAKKVIEDAAEIVE